jgi:hypothetical protein
MRTLMLQAWKMNGASEMVYYVGPKVAKVLYTAKQSIRDITTCYV